MESVIREGALRLLTTESSCDVILSCQGHRVTAHKVILSMASPLFRDLLKDASSDPTVIIFPDISGNTMSLVLDYIYTGSVVVYSNTIQDFLSLAALLKIHLDVDFDKILTGQERIFSKCDHKFVDKKEEIVNSNEVYSRRNQRRLPKLMPIRRCQGQDKLGRPKRLCSYVLPSPWCPRVEGVYGDPRIIGGDCAENLISPTNRFDKLQENDSNNNFQSYSLCHYKSITFNGSFRNSYHANSLEKDKLSLESYRMRSTHNSLCNSTISRPPHDDLSKFSNQPLSLEVCRTGKEPELVIDEEDCVLEPSLADQVQAKNDNVDDCEDQLEEMRLSPRENCLDDSCNDVVEESRVGGKYKEKPFKCEECGKRFSQLRNYKYHRSVHEGTKEFAAKCSECGKTFNDKGYLSSHMKIHRDKKEYACPHCPKRFNQRVAYNMHLRIHTGLKPHECPTCGKSFSRKMLLKQHQRVHTGERPYTCPECGKTFADRSNMSLHARLHTGVKPYACNLCPKSFTKKHHLKTHMNFHTGLKPYTCQKCGLAFSQSSNMRTHYKKCLLKTHQLDNGGGVEGDEGSDESKST